MRQLRVRLRIKSREGNFPPKEEMAVRIGFGSPDRLSNLAHVDCKEDILTGTEVAPTTPIEDHFGQTLSVKFTFLHVE